MNPFDPNKIRNNVVPNTKAEIQAQLGVAEEEPVVAPEPKKKQKKNPIAGLIEEKPVGKNYSVFLGVDLVEEIDRIAVENNTSRSKIMDVLLRQAIFGK